MSQFAATDARHATREVETTDWEDVLVRHGIIQERDEVRQQRLRKEEAATRTEHQVDAHAELASRSLEQLELAEDDVEETVLRSIREKRLQELREKAAAERFGDVYAIQRADFVREVTEASRDCWVVLELHKDGIQESSKCSALLRELASRQRACKFVRIRSTDCVERWPDSSVPALFLYHEGVMQKQLVGLDFCGGAENATTDSMELALSLFGVFSSPLSEQIEEEAARVLRDARAVARKAARGGSDEDEPDVDDSTERERDRAVAAAAALASKVADLPSATSNASASKVWSPRPGVQLDGGGDDDDW